MLLSDTLAKVIHKIVRPSQSMHLRDVSGATNYNSYKPVRPSQKHLCLTDLINLLYGFGTLMD